MQIGKFRIGFSVKKIIALSLLLLSFLMLFLPWMSIHVKADGQKYNLERIIRQISSGYNYDPWADFKDDVFCELEDLSDDLLDYGLSFSFRRAKNVVKGLLDSEVSPAEAANALTFSGSLCGKLREMHLIDYGYEYDSTARDLQTASGALTAAGIGIWILFISAILLFFLACFLLLCDRKLGALPYLIVITLLFTLFAAAVGTVNKYLHDFSYDILRELSDELGYSHIYISASEIKLFHVTGAGIVSLILAIGAFVLSLIRIPALDRSLSGVALTDGGWKCPNCGMSMKTGSFCISCGAKRPPEPPKPPKPPKPRKPRCTNCGSELLPGAAFCPYCGAPAPAPAPAAPAYDAPRQYPAPAPAAAAPAAPVYDAPRQYPAPAYNAPAPSYPAPSYDAPAYPAAAYPPARHDLPLQNANEDLDEATVGPEHYARKSAAAKPVKSCPNCGNTVNASDNVCFMCGYRFNAAPDLPGTAAPSAGFGRPSDDDL